MLPEKITQNTDPDLPTATVTWIEPTADDNSGSVTLTTDHDPGTEFPIGETVVTYTATDKASNSVMQEFIVEVEGMIGYVNY